MKFFPRLIPAVLFVVAVFPLTAQVGPAATEGGVPVVVGAGISDFSLDWGPGKRMEGVSAWVDYFPRGLPHILNGLGFEVIGHGIDYDRPAALPRMRQDSAEGGAIYSWNHYRNFRPYGKFLVGVGSIDFSGSGNYTHDSFLVTSPAGGVEYRVWRHVWVRADYEYQFWHQTFGPNDLNPNGFTIGASYDFRHWRSR